ncbi:MAG: DNRLRE domain-containing protein [Thermoplasmata archaeon]|nr:MAG: DNRLRE domain-containing protein [Thermoplasmata archaeon]
MEPKNVTRVGYSKNSDTPVIAASAVFAALFFISLGLLPIYLAGSEPIVTDNLNGTITANWPLENSSYYNLYNLSMENGEMNLSRDGFWWNQTEQSQFETGTLYNIDTTSYPDDITLNSTVFKTGENFIKNGRFETSDNWSFTSSDNITSEWNASGKYGRLFHTSIANPIPFGEQNVESASTTGSNGVGSTATDVIDALQLENDTKFWEVGRDEYILVAGFNITNRTGKIINVVLLASYRVESGYDGGDGSSGNSSLQFKGESGVFENTTIVPVSNTNFENESHDITNAFTTWTWSDVENLEVRFVNPDDQGPDDYVEWDRIWLEIEVEGFEQTAYINQTFNILNTTGFNDTKYEDFTKNTEENDVNFTIKPDSVVLDYSGAFSMGQTELFTNDTGGAATWIYAEQNDRNYGSSIDLWTGGLTRTRTLIRFNLSNIPAGSIIFGAELVLWVEWVVTDIPVAVYRVTADWDEGYQDAEPATDGVTWDNADTDPLIDWKDGGEFDPSNYTVSWLYEVVDDDTFHSFNITSLVQEWINGTPNYGLLLNDTNDGQDRSVRFTSDDGLNASRRPRLVINYAAPDYLPYGNFTSQVFDAEKDVDSWGNISWNADTPLGTAIALETRTSPDNIIWGNWSGNYSQSGAGIKSAPGRYIQYRAHLQTADTNVTPTLYDVTLIFERTNLTFERLVESYENATSADMSIAINDTIAWGLDIQSTSTWVPEHVDISELILSKGIYNISLRLHLTIETANGVKCSVGYDNFTVGTPANETIGEYISIGFNATSQAIWNEISWNATLQNGTNIIIQTRTSPDKWNWGPWSPAYSKPSGDPITSADNQYIQYRAILSTTNASSRPFLHNLNIYYSKYRWNGTLEMKSDFTPAAVSNWGQFSSGEDLKGLTIEFFYSINSGGTWFPVGAGDLSGVDTSDKTIRFKAEFSTTDTSLSPTLYDFSLTYLTNNPPQFSLGGYTNETGGFGQGWYNFSVLYLDPDNDYPAPLKICLMGPVSYNLTMTDLDASDGNLTDGKWFYYNITLEKGFYQYRFIAHDGTIWNRTAYDSFVVKNRPPELMYGNVWPPAGPGGTAFNFTVTYFDLDNEPPDALYPVNLTVNGPTLHNVTMMELDPSDNTYSDGKEYYYNLILEKGAYDYFFTVNDGFDWGGTSPRFLDVANNPPVLSSPSVLPAAGDITTIFNFTVSYTDYDNDSADVVTLNLSGPSSSGPYIMMELDPDDNVYTDGKLYYFIISNLEKGVYTHHFAANDSQGDWRQTGEIILPEVLNSKPQISTSSVEFADEDALYSVQYLFSDIDNDTCVWNLNTNASWLSIDLNTGYLNGTPDNGDVGWFLVNVTLSDNDGGLNWTEFILTVNNTPPQITTTSPTPWAVEGYLYTFDFDGQDEGEASAYWNISTNGSWLSIDQPTGVLSGTPGTTDIGSFWVNVTLYDANGGYDRHNFSVTVNDTSPPLADAGPDGFTWVNIPYLFDGGGSTDNSGWISNYTWYFGDGSVGYGVSPAHTYTNKSVFAVTLVVRDPTGNEGFDTVNVTVLNSAPSILTEDITFADEDVLYSVQYLYFDIDNDICAWYLDTNASWLTINPSTGYLNGTPDNGDVGWFTVNVTLSDNDGGLNSTEFVLTVNNTFPQIISTAPDPWVVEGEEYRYDFDGDDEGQGSSNYVVVSNASWLAINPVNGELYGTPSTPEVGRYWVNVTLRDGNGGYDSINYTITVIDISPPSAHAGVNDIAWEDTPYSFDGSSSADNSGQISNYTWYFGDGGVAFGVSPTHEYSDSGVYLVVLFVTDPDGNQGLDTVQLTVYNVDPVADAGADLTGNEGEGISFDASLSYDTTSDNDSLVYLWDFDSDGNFDDGFGMTPSYIWYDEGTYNVFLKVIDDNGNFSTDMLNVTISNLPPQVSLEEAYSGIEGDAIHFLATASDPGDDALSFRWDWDFDGENDTAWSGKSYANHTWTLFGTYTISVEVWDGDDGFGSTAAQVHVIRPEQPPVISGVGGRYVHFDYPYLLDLDPYVYDPDTPKGDLIVTTDSPHIEVNGLILSLDYPESMVGWTDVVILTVSDGKNQDNDTLTVSITDNFPPEVVGELPDVSFDEGDVLKDVFDLDNYFSDKDNDPLSYHFIGNVHVRPLLNASTSMVSFSADPNWFGIENITIRAYDPNGAFTEQSIMVTVNPVNFPPTIGNIQDVHVRLDTPWELLVLNPVYVWDDDSILDLILSTDSSFVTVSPDKEGVLVFYYMDPALTTDTVKISVSDGEFTASTDVNVHISLINWPPYIKDYNYPSNVRFDEDTTLSNHFDLNDYFADNASDQLTFTREVPTDNLNVNIDSQGQVSFSAAENWFGVTTVTFRAQDTAGAWASFTINVTVVPVNDPPEILQTITFVRIDADETWLIDLDDYFQDIESGHNLTFTCNKPDIKIDPTTHEARWERNGEDSLDGVVFTASDGEDSVSMEPINLKVVGAFDWLWVVIAAVLGALGVFAYRGLRYRYKIEEVLLVDHAGILLCHLSLGKSRVAVDAELVSGMLTAVQDFVKDSFLRGRVDEEEMLDKKKSLEKLEFAGHHLVLEQGKYSFLCCVISGTVNKRLRKRMRAVLSEFETEYDETLRDWDGVIERLEGSENILKKLIPKGEKPEKVYGGPVEELEISLPGLIDDKGIIYKREPDGELKGVIDDDLKEDTQKEDGLTGETDEGDEPGGEDLEGEVEED